MGHLLLGPFKRLGLFLGTVRFLQELCFSNWLLIPKFFLFLFIVVFLSIHVSCLWIISDGRMGRCSSRDGADVLKRKFKGGYGNSSTLRTSIFPSKEVIEAWEDE